MKLTIEKFRDKFVIIKSQKKSKIPDKCLDCYYLSVTRNEQYKNDYYFCSEVIHNPIKRKL